MIALCWYKDVAIIYFYLFICLFIIIVALHVVHTKVNVGKNRMTDTLPHTTSYFSVKFSFVC